MIPPVEDLLLTLYSYTWFCWAGLVEDLEGVRMKLCSLKLLVDGDDEGSSFYRDIFRSFLFAGFVYAVSTTWSEGIAVVFYLWVLSCWILGDLRLRQFTLLLGRVRYYLGCLNRGLNSSSGNLESMVGLHSRLITICVTLNDVYSLHLLAIITDRFFNLIAAAYFILEEYISTFTLGRDSGSIYLFLSYSLWIFICFIPVWHLTTACTTTTDQVLLNVIDIDEPRS
jgi:hypothetical protein